MFIEKPKVSIIIAVYNAENYLEKCLNSIMNQTFHDFEVILIDDGSTDDSYSICKNYAAEDSRFIVLHKSNGGVASARQAGIENAHGEFVIHVDPDDKVDEGMLEGLFRQANETNSDVVICDFYEETTKGVVYNKQQPTSLNCNDLILQLFKSLHGSCCNKLVRRSIIEEYGLKFPPISLCEDTYFCVSMLMHPIKVSYQNKAYYYYNRTNINSVTASGNPKTGLYAYQACREFRKLLVGHDNLWKAFVRDEMPWMAYLTLYYGAVSKNEYVAAYKDLASLDNKSCNLLLAKSALDNYYWTRFRIILKKKAGQILRLLRHVS